MLSSAKRFIAQKDRLRHSCGSIYCSLMAARNIPIDWQVPADLRSEYATNVLAQQGEHEFFLLFFQAQPPIILGELEEREKRLDALTAVPAKCVAKVIVSPDRLEEMIKMLTGQLEIYKQTFQTGKDKK